MTDPPVLPGLVPVISEDPNADRMSPDDAAASFDLALQDLIARARERGVSDEVIVAHLEEMLAAIRKGVS
jgi:hypothetical protein